MMKFSSLAISMTLLAQAVLWSNDILVTNLLDAGAGSLRAALTAAQDDDRVIFDPGLLGTITLLSALPTINADIEILGPASGGVNLSSALFPVFNIGIGQTVSISNIQVILAAIVGSGAGLFISDNSDVTVSDSSFSNCTATGAQGGAIHVGADAVLSANEVTFSGNSSGGSGDDIFLTNESTLNYTCTGTIPTIDVFGTGPLFKNGVGQVTFTVAASTPLTFIIEEGNVIATGTRTEPTIVYGRLEGVQTSLYIANHGTVKPSETIGTSVTTSDYYQADSATLEIAITPATTDLLQVGGNAYLQGTLSILPQAGSYTIGTIYTILTTGGVINSTFDIVTSSSLTFDVQYFTDRVDIEITSL